MANELVSVVIPAYRAGKYIRETLESVRAQTYANWEILVLEDGIFDETAETVRAFASTTSHSVRLIQKEKNEGVSRARNALLDLASGTFIAFIDADDLWLPEHLEYSVSRLQSEGADWLVGGFNLIDPDGKLIEANVLPEKVTPKELPARLLQYNFILPSALVARAAIFPAGLRFDPALWMGEDLDLCIRMVGAGYRVIYSERATLNYRKHPASATGDPARFSEGMSQLLEKYLHSPLVNQPACARALRDSLLTTVRLTRQNQPARSGRAAKRLLKLSPWSPIAWAHYLSVALRRDVTAAHPSP